MEHYAEIVQQNSLLRRLLGAGQEIQGWVNERAGEPRELSERAERLLFEVAHKEQASDFRLLSEILHDEVDRLERPDFALRVVPSRINARGGMGAVMGSKNLKALSINVPTKKIAPFDPVVFKGLVNTQIDILKEHPRKKTKEFKVM